MPPKVIKSKTKKSLKPKNDGLKKKAEENTRVVKTKVGEEPEVIKEGTNLDHTPQHNINMQSPRTVGVNVGVTKNMQNYESLRVDCWITDVVNEGETQEEAFNRVYKVASETLIEKVSELME